MAHYGVGGNGISHCQKALDHLGDHGPLPIGQSMPIALPSVSSLYLKLQARGDTLGTGTGFIVQRNGVTYLVTNRHVLRGGLDDEPVERPDCIVIVHNKFDVLGEYEEKTELLHDAEGIRRWYEHPTLGKEVDVAVLPLTQLDGVHIYAYDPWTPGPGLSGGVSEGLHIIGFPFGHTGGAYFGIWTKGFVATELDVDWRGLPSFLIDSRTRKGQSGSPVIAYVGGGMANLGTGSAAIFNNPVQQFFGIYSGRINAESDLGIVWKPQAIRDIIDAAQSTSPAISSQVHT